MAEEHFSYPQTRTGDAVDVYADSSIPDPYRWLEDPDAAETKAWVDAQNTTTAAYFKRFADARTAVRARLEKLQNFERVQCPFVRGDRAFAFRNTGLQNQDVLFALRKENATITPSSPPPLFEGAVPFLDLNAQFPDGTTAIGSSALSEDGAYYAYGLAVGGSDWQTLYVRDTATGVDLPDRVPWTKFTRIAWTHDNKGFFYSRHPSPPETAAGSAGTETTATNYCCVYYHSMGSASSEDLLVYADPAAAVWRYGVEVSDDGQYLLITTHKGTDPVNRVHYAHLPTTFASWKAATRPFSLGSAPPPPASQYGYLPLVAAVDNFEAEYDYVRNDGPTFLFRTNLSAPKYRVVALQLPPNATPSSEPTPATGPTPPVCEMIPESSADVLDWVAAVAGDTLVMCYLSDVKNVLKTVSVASGGGSAAATAATAASASIHSGAPTPSASSTPAPSCVAGGVVEVPLPGPGTIVSFSGRRDQSQAFVKFVSFLAPGTILSLTFGSGGIIKSGIAAAPAIHPLYETMVADFNASEYTVEQVFVPSTDGTVKIPLFIVRRRAATAAEAGTNAAPSPAPTLLYAYGGFNVSLQPAFSGMRLQWLQRGGVFAMACLRGGGEYGETWHTAGSRLNKQRVFDDLYACAEHLHGSGVASTLGVMGGSNGGLLACVAALQRPDLFRVSIAQVPVTDMAVGVVCRIDCESVSFRQCEGGSGVSSFFVVYDLWRRGGCHIHTLAIMDHSYVPSPPPSSPSHSATTCSPSAPCGVESTALSRMRLTARPCLPIPPFTM